MNRGIRVTFAFFAGILAVGCAHAVMLEPAPQATPVPGQKGMAVAENSGVRVTLKGEWEGDPGDLWRSATPVLVTIENHSGVPIALHYKLFTLTTSTGFQARALAPFNVRRAGVIRPFYPHDDFYMAGPLGPWFPDYPTWTGPFDYDSGYVDSYYQWQEPLPTSDMLAKALPNGVLENNGRVGGYLYFQKVSAGITSVTFNAEFQNAKDNADVAKWAIPLLVSNNGS